MSVAQGQGQQKKLGYGGDTSLAFDGYAPDEITNALGLRGGMKNDGINMRSDYARELAELNYTGIQTADDYYLNQGTRRVVENNFMTLAKTAAGHKILRRILMIYTMFPGSDGARLIEEVCAPQIIDYDFVQGYIEMYWTQTIAPTVVTEFGSGQGPSVSMSRISFEPFDISFATNFPEIAMKQAANAQLYNSLLLIAIAESYRDYLVCYCLLLVCSNYSQPKMRRSPAYSNPAEALDMIATLEIQSIGCMDRATNPVYQMAHMLDLVLKTEQLAKVDTMIAAAEMKQFFLAKRNAPFFITGKTEDDFRSSALSNLGYGSASITKILWIYSKTEPMSGTGDPVLSQDIQLFLMACPKLGPFDTLREITTLSLADDVLLTTTPHQLMEASRMFFTREESNGRSFLPDPEIQDLTVCHLYDNGRYAPSPFYYGDNEEQVYAIKLLAHQDDDFDPVRIKVQKVKHYLTKVKGLNLPDPLDIIEYDDAQKEFDDRKDEYAQCLSLFKRWQRQFGLNDLDTIYQGDSTELFIDFCVFPEFLPSDPSKTKKTATEEKKKKKKKKNDDEELTKDKDPSSKIFQSRTQSSPKNKFVAAKYDVSSLKPEQLAKALDITYGDDTKEKLELWMQAIKKWVFEGCPQEKAKKIAQSFSQTFRGDPEKKGQAVAAFNNFLLAVQEQLDVPGEGNFPQTNASEDVLYYTKAIPKDQYEDGTADKFGVFYDFSLVGDKYNDNAGYKQNTNTFFRAFVSRFINLGLVTSEGSGYTLARFAALDRVREHPIVLGFTALLLLAEFTYQNLSFMLSEGIPLPFDFGRFTQLVVTGLGVYFVASGGQSVMLMFSYPDNRQVAQRQVYQTKFITRARVGGIRIPDGPIFGYNFAKIYNIRSTDASFPMQTINFEFHTSFNPVPRANRGFFVGWFPPNRVDETGASILPFFNVHKSQNKDGNNLQGRVRNYMAPIWMQSGLKAGEYRNVVEANNAKYLVWPFNDQQDIGKKAPAANSSIIYSDNYAVRFINEEGRIENRDFSKLNRMWPDKLYDGAKADILGQTLGNFNGGPRFLYNS